MITLRTFFLLASFLVVFPTTIFATPATTSTGHGSISGASIYDLGELGPNGTTTGIGLNALGQVVGQATTGIGFTSEAFIGTPGTLSPIIPTPGAIQSSASSINNYGQVVGSCSGGAYPGGFLLDAGTYTALETLPGSPPYGGPVAINNSGQIVGSCDGPSGFSNAVLYSSTGVPTSLGTLGGGLDSPATGINDKGVVIGQSTAADGYEYGFYYRDLTMTKLEGLGGNYYGYVSWALGINNRGKIVGYACEPDDITLHATLFFNGETTDLGVLGSNQSYQGGSSFAFSINDTGEIVGTDRIGPSGPSHAFIYTSSTGMQDLNVLYASLLVPGTGSQAGFVTLEGAAKINDAGEILGSGSYWNGTALVSHSFLLHTRAMTTATPVISLVGGGNGVTQTVKLTDSSSGAVIYYTVDGTLPNLGSLVYGGPISVSSGQTVQALAISRYAAASEIATASF